MAPDQLLRSLFDAAVARASATSLLPHLPAPPKGRTLVVGAGKAAAAMAQAVEAAWTGPLSGLVVTRTGHGLPTRRIEVVEAAHPVPDAAGQAAAGRILDLARSLTPDDLLLVLLSGGGSALLVQPAAGLSLVDKQVVTRALLRSGASIVEINCVRKHLSAIKGGRLAAACAAPVVTLAVSDVVGDDPAVIASGPTVPDPTTVEQARAVLAQYGIAEPPCWSESPKSLPRVDWRLVASPAEALAAAAERARSAGLRVIDLGCAVEGDAEAVAAQHAGLALAQSGPAVILSGGETTVRVRGQAGRGGRNVHYLLALGLALGGAAHVHALAADSDGIDGSEDNAGAILRPDSLARARSMGLDPKAMLDGCDSYGFFEALGDLLVTGPTRTNVNDLRAILVSP